MSKLLEYLRLCRLCLVKENVNVPIFADSSDVRQIFLKISACLPVKVSQDDNLPKHICDSCLYKVDLLYQFWNTSVNAEKQLIQWITELGLTVTSKKDAPVHLMAQSQSHSQPHSITETIMLKEEHLEMETQQQHSYSGFDIPYQPEVNMTVGASADLDSALHEDVKVGGSKRRGRPPKQKVLVTLAPPVSVPVLAGRKRRSSATKAAAAFAAHASSDDSDADDKLASDTSEPDFEPAITKEEADSEDEEYVDNPDSLEPTTFVDASSTCDPEQAGPSGLMGAPVTTRNAAMPANTEPGNFYEDNKLSLKDPIEMEPIITIVELPATTNWQLSNKMAPNVDDSDEEPLLVRRKNKPTPVKQKQTKTSKRKSTPRKTKCEGYKNPFVYDHLNNKSDKKAPESKSKVKTKWVCLICSKNLTGKTELIEHYAAHKEDKIKIEEGEKLTENEVYQCEVCLKEFTSEKRFEKHAETHSDSRFNCEYCEKTFKRPYEYAVHMRFHSNDDKLKCHMCDYSTTYNSALKTHIKRHEAEYKYKCDLCDKGFFVHTWFEEHKNFHTGDKPFTCETCGKKFAYTRYLSAHKRSMHPETYGSQPVINECQFCQKRFAHKKSLLLHVRGHTGENTVLCDICGKRLSSNDHLKLHRRIHTGYKPYACTTCGKGFSKKCNLTLHERVHSGEKPYVCDVCGKCFSQRSTLVIHTRYHTGQRPYVCHLCNKGFVAKGVLSIHLKSCNRQNIIGHYLDPSSK